MVARSLWSLALLVVFTVVANCQDLATVPPVRAWPLERYLVDVMGVPFEGTSPYLVVELEGGAKGLFRSEEDEPWGSQAEVAGYRMSRWLNLDNLVPETVPRVLGRSDLPKGCWPYAQDSRLGSLQAFLPARPALQHEVDAMPSDRRAAMEILTFLMGRYDNHLGNTLIGVSSERDGYSPIFIVDFENGLEHQMVRYGEYAFVRKGQRNDAVPSVPGNQPFPFDSPQQLHNPTVEVLEAHMAPFRAPWSGPVESLHQLVANSLDQQVNSVVWAHHQWLQVKVRSRHPAYTDVYPPALLARLEELTLETLEKDILLPPFTRQHALAIMQRRDQILEAARQRT